MAGKLIRKMRNEWALFYSLQIIFFKLTRK